MAAPRRHHRSVLPERAQQRNRSHLSSSVAGDPSPPKILEADPAGFRSHPFRWGELFEFAIAGRAFSRAAPSATRSITR